MKMSIVSMFLLGAAFSSHSEELNLNWDWMISAEAVNHRDTQYTQPEEKAGTDRINGLLDVEAGYASWRGLFSLQGNNLYSSDDTEEPDSRFIIRELFWQDVLNIVDSSIDVTLGKIRLDWGVGYGYRPLDIFRAYRRNPVGIQVEEGTGVASVSHFDSQGEWTLLYTDASWSDLNGSALEKASEQQGIGARRYKLSGDNEYQWLVYYDNIRHSLVGGSVVSVLNTAWEVHASAVYQSRYMGYVISETYEPVELQEQKHALQGLIGTTWAGVSGQSVVAEYWYDGRSWSGTDWKKADKRVKSLAADPGFNTLRYSYAQGFSHTNLMQHNLMLHWTLDASSGWGQGSGWPDTLTPTLDLLYSPVDNGIIATQWLNYLLSDTGQSKTEMEVALRYFGGDAGSLYASLPDDFIVLFNVKGKF
jgi:hypothetical protein